MPAIIPFLGEKAGPFPLAIDAERPSDWTLFASEEGLGPLTRASVAANGSTAFRGEFAAVAACSGTLLASFSPHMRQTCLATGLRPPHARHEINWAPHEVHASLDVVTALHTGQANAVIL